MKNSAEKIFTDLKNEFSAYVGLKWHLWKLITIERVADYLSALSHALILLLFLFFSFLFFFLALGFVLGEWLGSIALGFLLVCVLYIGLAYIWVILKKEILFWMLNLFVKILHVERNDDEKNREEMDSIRPIIDGEADGAN